MKGVIVTALSVATVASASDVTPVQKVVQLLKKMKEEGVTAMGEEQTQYAKFKQFCELTLAEKTRVIDDAAETMDVLQADSNKAELDAVRLGNEAAAHGASAEASKQEQEKATSVRETERKDFTTTLQDYTESIDAIDRAMKSLKEKPAASKTSLLQVAGLSIIPESVKRSLNALLMENAAVKAGQDQSASSAGVMDMLEQLQNKFLDERVALEKSETQKKHAYDLLMQGLKSQQEQDKKEMSQKSERKGKRLQEKTDANVDFQEASAAREADLKYKGDLQLTCNKKASDFQSRQKVRKEELEAVGKAIEIIAGQAVAGSAEKHLPALLQKKKGSALIALHSHRHANRREHGKEDVIQFLQGEANNLKSSALSTLVEKLQAPDLSAIENVKNLIENLITKLNKQAEAETSKKAYCDKELSSNQMTRSEKSEAVDSIQAGMDQLEASSALLAKDIAEAGSDITKLTSAMAEATELRRKEKAKNQQTIKEAVSAQNAVAQAMSVLKEFYESASYATSLLQEVQVHSKNVAGQPDIFGDKPYAGMGGASGGVLGMMDVIQTDFARLEAETTASESAAGKEFDEFMEDSKVDKSKKEREVDHKTSKKAEQAQELASMQADFSGTQKELDAANAYFEKLKPDCVDAGVAYEERKVQREQEIKDLEMALDKLGGSD
eukprot:TRINITY_DN94068_c0_g1_i1.p1 TRINITY_DN94068_c0_g1~~TRINITY_DN94068_c0_g1_i1.p1  ORF type:complete len:670 (-),score=218.94 TRINITY_DN94068_c0_g1_i1:181-2190(-)